MENITLIAAMYSPWFWPMVTISVWVIGMLRFNEIMRHHKGAQEDIDKMRRDLSAAHHFLENFIKTLLVENRLADENSEYNWYGVSAPDRLTRVAVRYTKNGSPIVRVTYGATFSDALLVMISQIETEAKHIRQLIQTPD